MINPELGSGESPEVHLIPDDLSLVMKVHVNDWEPHGWATFECVCCGAVQTAKVEPILVSRCVAAGVELTTTSMPKESAVGATGLLGTVEVLLTAELIRSSDIDVVAALAASEPTIPPHEFAEVLPQHEAVASRA